MNPDYPPFPEAIARLECFADEAKWPRSVSWVRRGDAIRLGQRVFVRSIESAEKAQRVYERAAEERTGVVFEGLGVDAERAYIMVWSPIGDGDGLLLCDGLKLTLPEVQRSVLVTGLGLKWLAARIRGQIVDPER